MRSYYGRVVLATLHVFHFSRAFSITHTPTVTLGQVEPLTWFRDANTDPTVFELVKWPGNILNLETIAAISVQNQATQGLVPVTFNDAPGQVTIAAYTLSPTFKLFFTDPNPITIMRIQSLAQTSPSIAPQTTAPGITTVVTSITSVLPSSTESATPVAPNTSSGVNHSDVTTGSSRALTSTPEASSSGSPRAITTPSGDNNTFPVAATTDSVANKNPTFPSAPSDALQSHSHPNVGVVAGGVVGGMLAMLVIAAFVFYTLKRRNKKMNCTLDPIPYLDTSGSGAPDMDISEQKMQMLKQRERLEGELEAYEQASQNSSSGTGAVPDGINGSNQDDIARVLRRVEVLTQRIATLEAGMAPPDYSSGTA